MKRVHDALTDPGVVPLDRGRCPGHPQRLAGDDKVHKVESDPTDGGGGGAHRVLAVGRVKRRRRRRLFDEGDVFVAAPCSRATQSNLEEWKNVCGTDIAQALF